jgi:hypothetical protein
MSTQNPLTLVTPIKPERLEDLYGRLSGLKYALEKGRHSLLEDSETIHYMRWVIIDDTNPNNENSIFFQGSHGPPKLVFSSNFDGFLDQHIEDLCSHEEEKLIDHIYECCEDYPETGTRSLKTRINYLKKYQVKVSAFYQGSVGRTVKQIRAEQELRLFLRDLLNQNNWPEECTAKEVHRKLRDAAGQQFPALKNEPFRMPRRNWFRFTLMAVVILLLLPIIVIWLLIVQFRYERKDEYFTKTRSDLDKEKIRLLEEYEDLTDGEDPSSGVKNKVIFYQNQFTQLVEMKPGKVRLITFKAMMLFARNLIPSYFVKGELMGIPTIHFARWVLFDDDKRVLFFSNFDGSWQQYLGDFIDLSGWGLSAIFSNTKVFPKTNFLGISGLFAMKKWFSKTIPSSSPLWPGGAYDEEHFLAWSRNSELQTQIWYSAYPQLSIKNVNNNSNIRSLLFKNLSEKQAKAFFQLI